MGLVLLVILLGAHVWSKTQEIAELRGLVRGIERRAETPLSPKQLDQLFALVTRSQQGFRELIDAVEDPIFALSLSGEICTVNRCVSELLGRPFADLIGHRLDEFLEDPNGRGRAAAEATLPKLFERKHWEGIVRVRLRHDATERYFDCVLHAIVKDGRAVGISGIARDITRQRENELRFTHLFQTLQEGVYFTDAEGDLLEVNSAMARLLAYANREELLQVKLDNLYLDPAQRAAELEEIEQRGSVYRQEITLRRKDGRQVTCLHTSAAIRDAAGQIVRFQGTLVDITQRREIERQLHQEQEFARRLVESFPDVIVALDTQGRYTFVSRRITAALGYQPQELLGEGLGDRIKPQDRSAVLEMFRELVGGKRDFGEVEYRTRHKDGRWRVFRATATPLFNLEGKIAGVIASARDVTDVKLLEQQLIQSEKLAAVGQMIAGVAHELNNPLTAIFGVAELLRERTTDETTRRQLELVHRQARRAADIVQNLLAFSRPPAPQKGPVKLNDLLQRTLQLHEASLRKNQISVHFAARPDLPAVVGDANQLTQVFLNLISNAEQAIREARDSGTLEIQLSRLGNNLLITFEDDGPGIRPEALPRVFDPFFTTKRPGRGTGLGLSISMAIIREHGGNIQAESLPHGGARFTVSLPIAAVAQEKAAETSKPKGEAPTSVSPKGLAVLVVDDEESIRELVHIGLTTRGIAVDCVATAEEALDKLAGHPYDAVLCDLHLGGPGASGLSGQELYERLQGLAKAPKPLFIFMTGDLAGPATVGIGGDPGDAGPVRLLHKPFRISELFAYLSRELFSGAIPAGRGPAGRDSQ